jgi:hypothetical protein
MRGTLSASDKVDRDTTGMFLLHFLYPALVQLSYFSY